MNETEKTKKAFPWGIAAVIVCIAVFAVFLIMSIRSFTESGNIYCDALSLAYDDAYDEAEASAYDEYYTGAYDNALEKYHVSNDVTISIDNIKEVSRLEVYEGYDTEYVIHDKDDGYDFETWYQIDGSCTYYVDLEKSEFIVDQQRKSVTVIIPKPEMKFGIDPPDCLFDSAADDALFNGSNQEGTDDYSDAQTEGFKLIKDFFQSNETLMQNAEEAAVNTIECLVENANSGVDGLTVTVEFME